MGFEAHSGYMSKKSKERITEDRLKAGVKISSKEGKNLLGTSVSPNCGEFINPPRCKCNSNGIVDSTSQSEGGMFPSLDDDVIGGY